MPQFVFIYPQIQRLTGAQRLILQLAGALAALPDRPCQVTILTHRMAPECRAALPVGVGLIETGRNLNLTGNHYLDSLVEYLAVPALLARLPPGLSAICFFGPPSLPGLWWARHIGRLKIPLLYFCYEPPRAAYTDRQEVTRRMGKLGWLMRPLLRLYRPVDKYLAGQASAILVNGQYGRRLIWQTYRRESFVITHGAELARGPEVERQAGVLRQKYGLGHRPVLITVNHLHPRKRVDLLIRTLPLVLAHHPDATALIIGQGPEEAALRALGQALGLDRQRLVFAGFVPEQELAAHYALATIYVHTGREETFGLSVLEAAMSGLPVVAADEGGPREILREGETGFLVEADPAAFAARLNWLLSDSDRAASIGQANAAHVRASYTWEQGARDFLQSI